MERENDPEIKAISFNPGLPSRSLAAFDAPGEPLARPLVLLGRVQGRCHAAFAAAPGPLAVETQDT